MAVKKGKHWSQVNWRRVSRMLADLDAVTNPALLADLRAGVKQLAKMQYGRRKVQSRSARRPKDA